MGDIVELCCSVFRVMDPTPISCFSFSTEPWFWTINGHPILESPFSMRFVNLGFFAMGSLHFGGSPHPHGSSPTLRCRWTPPTRCRWERTSSSGWTPPSRSHAPRSRSGRSPSFRRVPWKCVAVNGSHEECWNLLIWFNMYIHICIYTYAYGVHIC